jgi:hypothetical protein
MVSSEGKNFADKHGNDAAAEPRIQDEIVKRATGEKLPCALAFRLAESLKIAPERIGMNVDLLNFRLTKCQLGLFGYSPEKKIVKSVFPEKGEIRSAITAEAAEGRLSCRAVWDIARRLNVSKMTVSSACEAMNIKIKPCQLGAF